MALCYAVTEARLRELARQYAKDRSGFEAALRELKADDVQKTAFVDGARTKGGHGLPA